ncbi:MAG: hypothetical protein A2921_03765 [Candidatus Magasanikbacteria bacterium RIFCSPLOWO2_01_FULL_43_20b]|uniref:Uncharacterized protein n=1 Tax=Candidatus Magasanikbacteria bacterium RIFCSPLOWO2_12_FULL_43_12 TaxID=1798692 RepID=A0A1F6MRQ3_9BACT|nr:MAG: hypothetical protein A3C74_00070 [Candidatus Magasanikbacteria bacterium RIFCSPHIGHO2_02_FULL_44_13]OGH72518.1 MAG: hypothetical protein A3I93_04355 [Candidatus Magasanikbacteria bacterium RIFCSPLOWO2_02_FULL_43_22]OGH73689.1 MAG: hypothetical protein A2921_03765 [Candidatus Magasanikbacteria bacterium RIFCSPLOWO2_01_FULL_43_20b]OGH74103.1 MAG: hypothetical protein A3G00_05025 [Candidatus Magasanikbacteria bacterium RIFCSPLOWO2_12_FULL_43_12]
MIEKLSKGAPRGWRGEDLRERNREILAKIVTAREGSTATHRREPRIVRTQIPHERPHMFTAKETRILKKGTQILK